MIDYTVYEGYYYGPNSGCKRKYEIEGSAISPAGSSKILATISDKCIFEYGKSNKYYWYIKNNSVYYRTPQSPTFNEKPVYRLKKENGYLYVYDYNSLNRIVYTIVSEKKVSNTVSDNTSFSSEQPDDNNEDNNNNITPYYPNNTEFIFVLALLFVPFFIIFILFEVWGEVHFNAVFTRKVFPFLRGLLPIISAGITYHKLTSTDNDIPVSHVIISAIISFLCVLLSSIFLTGNFVADFAYDLLPNDNLDIGYYFILPLFVMIPIILHPLFLRFVINKSNYKNQAKDIRESISVTIYYIMAILSMLIIIGKAVINEPDILSALFCALLLIVLQAISLVIGFFLRMLFSKAW